MDSTRLGPATLDVAPSTHSLSGRLATWGLVLVLLAMTAFSVTAAVLTSRATETARMNAELSALYAGTRAALLEQESSVDEFLAGGDPEEIEEFHEATPVVRRALQAVVGAEGAARRAQASELLTRYEDYVEWMPALFASVPPGGAAGEDDYALEPLYEGLEDAVVEQDDARRQETQRGLADLHDLQRVVLFATPMVFGIGLAILGLFAVVLRDHRREIDVQADENRHQALHDSLTGLPNRALLRQRTQVALEESRASGEPVALMLIDLDRFKEINDTLGHHYGDVVLQAVSDRLQGTLRASDTVARLGGDEFAILLPAVGDVGSALDVAARARRAMEATIEADGVSLDVDASFGIVLNGDHGDDVETMLQHADIAMYHAKERGLGVTVYDHDLNGHSPERLGLLGELRRAIDNDELVLHFQPKVGLPDDRVCGVEALVRWQHPERGMVPPALFIPVAERTALIRPLTRWVIDAALAQCRKWQDAGHVLQVAVNVSARNLLDEHFVDDVLELLARWQVPASCLELEVTESAIMTEPERALLILTRFADLGITLSIDDFGAGYTSLAHLKKLPVHQLKIDRSFVSQMNSDRSDALIVQSVVELGRNLGLRTVAEGVEDRATLDQLSDLGCDIAQGYYLSRPLPADALEAWFEGARQDARA